MLRYEIVFVDDNSPDGTSEEVQVFMKKSAKCTSNSASREERSFRSSN